MDDKNFNERFESDKKSDMPPVNVGVRKFVSFLVGAVVLIVVLIMFVSRGDDPLIPAPPSMPAQTPPPPAASTPVPAAPPTFKLRETATAGKLDVIASKVAAVTEFKTEYSTIKTENQFVVIDVKITNNDDRARDISSNMFTLVDGQGRTYEAYDRALVDNRLLVYETVNPGLSRSKIIVFETGKDVKATELRVDSGVAFASTGSVTIKLAE